MYDTSEDQGPSAPTDYQVGDIISYCIRGRTYTGEILDIRPPTIANGKQIGWHYMVMREGANTCMPDFVLASAVLAP
jgi:hypothetical protein